MPKLTTNDILGPDGLIAARLPHYEMRSEQLEMADAVARAVAEKKDLIVEAGTGVGKSFAYLVPTILHASDSPIEKDANRPEPIEIDPSETPHHRVVIATHTISLQEQLIHKDIPLLNSVIPREWTTVLVKGRSNYISLRRLRGSDRTAIKPVQPRRGIPTTGRPCALGKGNGRRFAFIIELQTVAERLG